MFKRTHFVVLVLAMAVVIAACGGGDAGTDSGGGGDVVADADPIEIEVILSDFEIEPSVIEIQRGQPVTMTVINEGPDRHDLVIEGLGLNVATKELAAGEQEVIQFTAQTSGKIETYCSVPGHKTLGMVGELQIN